MTPGMDGVLVGPDHPVRPVGAPRGQRRRRPVGSGGRSAPGAGRRRLVVGGVGVGQRVEEGDRRAHGLGDLVGRRAGRGSCPGRRTRGAGAAVGSRPTATRPAGPPWGACRGRAPRWRPPGRPGAWPGSRNRHADHCTGGPGPRGAVAPERGRVRRRGVSGCAGAGSDALGLAERPHHGHGSAHDQRLRDRARRTGCPRSRSGCRP